jgi:glucose-1-phosphatase
MKVNQIRCIFFDLGNVLLDLDYGKFSDRMISMTGLEIEQLRAALTAGGAVLKYEVGACNDEEFLAEISSHAGVRINPSDFLGAWNCIFAEKPLLPDAVLFELSGRLPLWVLSNTNKMHFEFLRERFRFLNDYFRGWILSYEVGVAKPDPSIYTHALRRAGFSADEALFVDDQPVNVKAARKLGMDAFQFLNPAQLIQELQNRCLLPKQTRRLDADP